MTDRDSELEALSGIDRVLEHRIRLAICALLARSSDIAFTRFKELLGETDGSLGANLQRLEQAGYITSRKEFADRRPVTWYALTKNGRTALRRHVAAIEELTKHVSS